MLSVDLYSTNQHMHCRLAASWRTVTAHTIRRDWTHCTHARACVWGGDYNQLTEPDHSLVSALCVVQVLSEGFKYNEALYVVKA